MASVYKQSSFVAALCTAIAACSSSAPEDPAYEDSVTGIPTAIVGLQTIGNCWIYATNSWVETLHTRAGGGRFDLSESYLTYWSWFSQLDSAIAQRELSVGGDYSQAAYLLAFFGAMPQSAFVSDDVSGQYSKRQEQALANMNTWLKNGGLERAPTDKWARRAYLRDALDTAWSLSTQVKTALDTVFGKEVRQSIGDAPADTYARFKILRPAEFSVAVYAPGATAPRVGMLDALVGKPSSTWLESVGRGRTASDVLKGPDYVRDTAHPATGSSAAAVRSYWRRMQRMLHQGIPVWGAWWVENSSMTADGSFSPDHVRSKGSSGGSKHASLFIDYDATLYNGTSLHAGTKVTDPALLNAALREDTSFMFWRIQNSWGSNPAWNTRPAGTNDLDYFYLTDGYPLCSGCKTRGPYMLSAAIPDTVEP